MQDQDNPQKPSVENKLDNQARLSVEMTVAEDVANEQKEGASSGSEQSASGSIVDASPKVSPRDVLKLGFLSASTYYSESTTVTLKPEKPDFAATPPGSRSPSHSNSANKLTKTYVMSRGELERTAARRETTPDVVAGEFFEPKGMGLTPAPQVERQQKCESFYYWLWLPHNRNTIVISVLSLVGVCAGIYGISNQQQWGFGIAIPCAAMLLTCLFYRFCVWQEFEQVPEDIRHLSSVIQDANIRANDRSSSPDFVVR